MPDPFVVLLLVAIVIVVGVLGLVLWGPGQRQTQLPPDDPIRRAQLDVAARMKRPK